MRVKEDIQVIAVFRTSNTFDEGKRWQGPKHKSTLYIDLAPICYFQNIAAAGGRRGTDTSTCSGSIDVALATK
jgi:hypothetical protein